MKKVMALVLALTLVVTALGVLTVAEDQEDVVKVSDNKVSVLPEAFDDKDDPHYEDGEWIVNDNGKVKVKVDPIHVTK